MIRFLECYQIGVGAKGVSRTSDLWFDNSDSSIQMNGYRTSAKVYLPQFRSVVAIFLANSLMVNTRV